MPDDDPGDDLYGAPLDEFVARRNALAKELRGDGRRDDAAVVAKLRRPSAGAWALNQVARTDPERVATFLGLVERFSTATDAAMAGDAQRLREVQTEARPAIDDVVRAAMSTVAGSGRNATDDLKRRVADTLHAALVDAGVARELEAGRLTDDHAAPGFGFGVGGAEVTDLATVRAKRRPKEDRAEAEARRAEQRAQREREKEAERLDRRAVELERKASEAEERAAQLRLEADAARAEADDAASS